jgi:hypothetical protein
MTIDIPTRRAVSWLRLATAWLLAAAVLWLLAPAALAQDGGGDGSGGATADGADAGEIGAVALNVTTVDATTSTVELAVLGVGQGADLSDLALTERGEPVDVARVTTSQDEGRPTEVVLIVDTNARSAEGDVLGRVEAALTAALDTLPPSTSVAVISAGESALIESRLTSDHDRLAAAIEDLSLSTGSSIYDAIWRAGSLFSDDEGVVRSVVVLSTGVDTGSERTLDAAQVPIVQKAGRVSCRCCPQGG